VPVAVLPLTTKIGLTETLTSGAGSISKLHVTVWAAWEAVRVAKLVAVTAMVVTAKVAEVAPCGTVTEPGSWAAELFEERLINEPPAGAADDKVTVPVAPAPPRTAFGATVIDSRFVGLIVRVAVFV